MLASFVSNEIISIFGTFSCFHAMFLYIFVSHFFNFFRHYIKKTCQYLLAIQNFNIILGLKCSQNNHSRLNFTQIFRSVSGADCLKQQQKQTKISKKHRAKITPTTTT